MTVVFAGLSCWLLIEHPETAAVTSAWPSGATSAVLGLFPLVVALALRQTAPDAGSQNTDIRQAPRDSDGTSPRRTLVAHEQTTRGRPELADLRTGPFVGRSAISASGRIRIGCAAT